MAHRHASGLYIFVVIIRSVLAAIMIAGAVLTILLAILGTIGGGIPVYVWLAGIGMLLLGMMFASVR